MPPEGQPEGQVKDELLARFARALFLSAPGCLDVKAPVVILQHDKSNPYHVLEKHLRAESLPVQEKWWKSVRQQFRPALETWRPRVNGVQLKVLQGARLPESEEEWGAVAAALDPLSPHLRSDTSPARLVSELRDFVALLDVWWQHRKRGEGGPGSKRPVGPPLALPINKRQSLEFVQQAGLIMGPIFVQPEIISHSLLAPSPPLLLTNRADGGSGLLAGGLRPDPSDQLVPVGGPRLVHGLPSRTQMMELLAAEPGGERGGGSGGGAVAAAPPQRQGSAGGSGSGAGEEDALAPRLSPMCRTHSSIDPQAALEAAAMVSAGSAPQALPPLGAAGSMELSPRQAACAGQLQAAPQAQHAATALECPPYDPSLDHMQLLELSPLEAEIELHQTHQHQQQELAFGLAGGGGGGSGAAGAAGQQPAQQEKQRAAPASQRALEKTFVTLNVGGHRFPTTAATLAVVEGSFLWKLAQQCAAAAAAAGAGDSDKGSKTASQAPEFFIDRSGKLFEYVLDYLRSARFGEAESCLPREERTLGLIRREAEFYQLSELAERAAVAQIAAAEQAQQAQHGGGGGGREGEGGFGGAGPAAAAGGGLVDAVFLETGMQPAGSLGRAQAALLQQLNYMLQARQAEGYAVVKQECGAEREGQLRNLYYHVMLRKAL